MARPLSLPACAWITGGGTGIGRALALLMARRGWRVVISGRRLEPLQETVAAADPAWPGRLYPLACDVTDLAALRAAWPAIERLVGGEVDLAVLNAGTYAPVKVEQFDPAVFAEHMQVNYQGVVNGLSLALPPMLTRGRGQVALVASVAGFRGLPRAAAYGPTKAALINLAESLRFDLEPRGITVSLVNPGFVRTPLTAGNRFDMPGLLEPEDAAERLYRGLAAGEFHISFPRRLSWWLRLTRLLPYPLYFWLMRLFTRSR
jgi:NAD(P)-dependent dehydrogenase (short-subunit alcohol dehydrogenase family)